MTTRRALGAKWGHYSVLRLCSRAREAEKFSLKECLVGLGQKTCECALAARALAGFAATSPGNGASPGGQSGKPWRSAGQGRDRIGNALLRPCVLHTAHQHHADCRLSPWTVRD